jgi:hypothetical protein
MPLNTLQKTAGRCVVCSSGGGLLYVASDWETERGGLILELGGLRARWEILFNSSSLVPAEVVRICFLRVGHAGSGSAAFTEIPLLRVRFQHG